MTSIRIPLLALLLWLAACAPVPQRAGIPTQWVPSPNFNERRPDFVIIHHTGDDTVEQALRSLTNPLREVSAHYLIGRDGTIMQLVDEPPAPGTRASRNGARIRISIQPRSA